MKIKIFDRILLTLFIIVSIALAVAIILVMVQVYPLQQFSALLEQLFAQTWLRILIAIVALAYIVVAVDLLFLRADKPRTPLNAKVKETENGDIRISIEALTSLSLRAARAIQGVRDVKNSVFITETGVVVEMRVSFMPEINIPLVSAELQTAVKTYIESNAGIHVLAVRVFVEDALNTSRAIVE